MAAGETYIIEVYGVIREVKNPLGSSGNWGEIGGNLTEQTDLQEELTTLQDSIDATNTALTTGLAGKQAAGDYATNADLTSGLASKQAAGDYATNTALTTGLAAKQNAGDYATNSALTSGLSGKADLVGGKVPSSQLPAYVDDVLEYSSLASFPGTGTAGLIYVATDMDLSYRWSGTQYTQISSGAVTAVNGHTGSVTLVKSDIGLSNVDNTSDATKNSATATLTNKTISGSSNTLSNIPQSAITGLSASLAAKQDAGDYATNTALTTGLATKQPTGDYATNSALTSGLATKQATGDYATNTALTSGLATKQDAGDYATNTALSTGLATKQDTLASGTNIKTINGSSILGSGDITIEGVGGSDPNAAFYLTSVSGTAAQMKTQLTDAFNNNKKVKGKKGDTYTIDCSDGPISITGKNIDFDGEGCTLKIIGKSQDYFLKHTNTYQASDTIIGIELDNFDSGTGSHGATVFKVTGDKTAKYKIGNLIRITSQELVDGNASGQANTSYKAEYIVAEYVKYDSASTSTWIYIQRSPSYTYTVNSNLKMWLCDEYSIKFKNCTIEVTNSQITTGVAAGGFKLEGSYAPEIDVTFKNLAFPGITSFCTYKPKVYASGINIMEEPPQSYGPPSGLSYILNDTGSFGIDATIHAHNLRHAFTTGANVNTFTNPFLVGETISARVTGTAKGCMHAWDTHPAGMDINFINCIAEGCGAGFQIRSRGTSILGGKANRCSTGVYVVANDAVYNAVYNYPVMINDLICEGCDINSVKITGTSTYKQPVFIKGCTFRGAYIEANGCELHLDETTIDTRRSFAGTQQSYFLAVTGNVNAYINNVKYITSVSNLLSIYFSGSTGNNIVETNNVLVLNLGSDTTPFFANHQSTTVTTNKLTASNWKWIGNAPAKPASSDLSSIVNNYAQFNLLRLSWEVATLDKHIWNGTSWRTV